MQILQFRGPTSAYLEPPTGKASVDVLKMAREGLMLPLRTAINKAKKDNVPVRKDEIWVQQNGTVRMVNVEVIPLKNLRERCFLILFEDADKAGRLSPGAGRAPRAVDSSVSRKQEPRRVHSLESELAETRDYLQCVQEQYEAANEELQSSNAEVQSANEELQSINEELEISKEELESANEELTTINEEMADRNQELSRLNADLSNLQASTGLPLLVIGPDLTILRFSPPAEKMFNLLAIDVGRSLSGIRHNLVAPESTTRYPIEGLVRDVIDNVRTREQEVLDEEGRWYTLRARPYFTLDNKVDGAVLMLVDITDLKRTEREVKAARDYAEAIIRTARDPLMILRPDLRVNTANEAFYKAFKVMPDETEGRLIYELGNQQWDIPKLRELLEEVLPRNSVFSDFEVTHDFPDIGRRTMLLNAQRLEQEDGSLGLILLAIEDVTERKRAVKELRESEEALRGLNDKLKQRVSELARSEDRLRALATELNLAEQRERKRLATELHDYLQQMLVLGKITIGQGKRVAVGVPACEQVLKKVDDIFSDALTYTRTLVSDLSPTVLRDHGLPAALRWLGTYMQKHNQLVTVTVPDDADLKLPEDQVILLFQFVRELLINSAKHAGTGEATVWMEQRDGLLRIEVRDVGAGFDLAADTAGRPSGGISSKFGLISIRERMRALGGSFELESAPGQGTTATLDLPLARSAEAKVLSAELSERGGKQGTQDSEHPTISALRTQHSALHEKPRVRVLLVDDHPLMREGLRSIVTGYPHLEMVGEGGDGMEAVELAQRLDPDVVVMDINMPKMDGIEATRRIKAHRMSTVVIGLSVNQSADTVEKMKAAGAAAYLTKESAADALCQAIDAAMTHDRETARQT